MRGAEDYSFESESHKPAKKETEAKNTCLPVKMHVPGHNYETSIKKIFSKENTKIVLLLP